MPMDPNICYINLLFCHTLWSNKPLPNSFVRRGWNYWTRSWCMSTGELLRHYRHNRIVRIIANTLLDRHWKVIEEFDCVSSDGSKRRVDIIAYEENSKNGFIIDPTVRYEKNLLQPKEVNPEKQRIYEPCVWDIQQRCKLKKLEVIGLFVGARGTISAFF